MSVSLQGGGRREVKVAVAYEGWRVRQGRGETSDYALVRPRYISGLDSQEGFWEQVRGAVGSDYRDVDDTMVVINGDDAAWIGAGARYFGLSLYQRDRFHVARDLRQALAEHPGRRQAALAAFRRGDAGGVVA